ncbi:MAG: T9SS type A sorting domain-containing protein [Candidatus Marinimicrobia bacterium]|jgi:hypothetical protein|nr:T9SS type A sorting domain-containing protein [Candidatus Neomarinimicrobiota bacterium]MBT3683864.1 T9SS type A sorting domain-containing protein [Candidatus Neomarinimicrobiota bacterium]MBT3760869.1 T9SS type A sorting domain-containing protein [Candidatus Neomarinimicrobiota bacterium]MBT3896860.1 T9SS type A sorting domain-containing protein [Candidatus Neomarinimicrobiota bacterium]MBT4538581.1 T9SS type A sorting domain-containing protein [Candidatus Neomarinimicrobiota bacterium]
MNYILIFTTFFTALFATVKIVPDDYPTIQSAINISLDGDTVFVNPGFYYENIDFQSKNIMITGNYINTDIPEYIIQTVIYSDGVQPTITFGNVGQNNNAMLYGVSIYSENIGVQLNNSNASIERCLLYNPFQGTGIYCNSSSPNIKNCSVRGFENAIYSNEGSHPYVSNSILWSDESGIIGSGSVEYSCVKLGVNGSYNDLGGIIYTDPIFDIPFYSGIELGWQQRAYPWIGYPYGPFDGKDNNPWDSSIPSYGGTIEYANWGISINGDTLMIGDGEANHGDLDGDGLAGEDWFNGIDDDFDGLIDEDYFFADGIDNSEPFTDEDNNGIYNLGEPFVDWNSDGVWNDMNDMVDENIDLDSDVWYDGYDNDGTGGVDDSNERLSNPDLEYPTWANNIENLNIILYNGRISPTLHGNPNPWYDPNSIDPHLRGNYQYEDDNYSILFDNYINDYGEDGIPGDPFDDLGGDGEYQMGENAFLLFGNWIFFDNGLDGLGPLSPDYPGPDDGEGDGIWQPGDGWIDSNGNGIVDIDGIDGYDPNITEDNYLDVWPPPNGIWDVGEQVYDYGFDGLPDTGDPGEGDGFHVKDAGENDGIFDTGDGCFGCDDDYVAYWQSMPGLPDVGNETINPIYFNFDGDDNDGDGLIDEYDEDGRYHYTLFRYFKLETSSPTIDAGDPDLNHDADGTIIDMGALQLNQFIYGCTDPTYCDWNYLANIDDGSCDNTLGESGLNCMMREYTDGVDNDGDWEIWANEFGWEGDINQDGNPVDFGEWGYVAWNVDWPNDTTGYTLYEPWEVFQIGNQFKPEYDTDAQFWEAVGVDEYHKLIGISVLPIVDINLELDEYIPMEEFTDNNGNGIWDDENWNMDSGYIPMEEFTDNDDDGIWDKGGWVIQINWEDNMNVQPGYYLDLNGDNIPDWGSENSIEYLYDYNLGSSYLVYEGNEIIAENLTTSNYFDYNLDENQYFCYSIDYQGYHFSYSAPYNEQCMITPDSNLSIDENIIPSEFKLFPIYPNPFNPITNIKFSLPILSSVKINMYDLIGRQIDELSYNSLSPGYHTITWDASKYSSGIYFIRVNAEDYHAVQKVILLK